MKKLFLFATIAAAGLFASCSSTDDAIGNAANNGIEGAESDAPAIKIGIGNLAEMATRGTGTVGGVTGFQGMNDVDAIASKWAGQHINVFMFTKGALDNDGNIIGDRKYETTFNLTNIAPADEEPVYLYNNTEMVTPGSAENLIPGMGAAVELQSGEAMIEGGTIQYYPLSGNFDFFGYHLDDALDNTAASQIDADTRPINKTADDKWTVPFEIDGSQDLMSTKAALTEVHADPNDATSALTGGQLYIMNNSNRPNDFYSAYAARRDVQPTLSFNHLLTRFAFFVKAGNKDAAGFSYAKYDADGAAAKNATLDGHKAANDNLTQEQADAYNATLTGALPVDNSTALTEAQANAYNATLSGAVSDADNNDVYSFKAWIDGQGTAESGPFYEGKVKSLGVDGDGYTKVKVISNEVPSFIGNEYAVHATDLNGMTGSVELLTVINHESLSPKIYVKGVDEADLTTDEINAYNATLNGHATAGQALATASAQEYNRHLTGALSTAALTAAQATLYNATLPGAVKAGDDDLTSDPQPDADKAVKVSSVKITSKVKGDMAVAWKGADAALSDEEKIQWNTAADNYAALTLKARPAYKKTSADAAALTDLAAYVTLKAEKDALEAANPQDQDAIDAKQAEIDALDLNVVADFISANTFTNILSDAGKAKYTALTAQEAMNEQLIALTPTAATWDATNNKANIVPVGEALIVGPTPRNDKSYVMDLDISQILPTNWKTGAEEEKTTTQKLLIKEPDGGWKINTSYNIILTVYSLERIEIITVITPWDQAADDIPVGGDDL